MLEHSLRLVLTQGIQGDHLPPLDLLGSRITGDSLSPLASPREGGIGPLFIPSRAQSPLSYVSIPQDLMVYILHLMDNISGCNGFHSKNCSTPQRQSMEI